MSDPVPGAMRANLKHLRAFRAVAQHGHFTRAAEAIGLSQPALSALIAQLEQDLGVRLLNRTTRALELTPAGHEFFEAAGRILGEMREAVLEARGHAQLRRGRLRIAALPSLCDALLPSLLRRFHREHSAVAISVFDLPANDVVTAARAGQVDFGLGHVPADEAESAEPILTDRLVAIASRELIREPRSEIGWQELRQFEIIAMAEGTSVRRLIDAGTHQANVALRIVLEPRQMATALAYAGAGLGVAILPSSGVHAELEGDLVRMTVSRPVIERTVSVIRASTAPLAPPAEHFLRMLRDHVRHHQFDRGL